jgi:hypothetical protein
MSRVPSLSDLHDAIELAPVDRREGFWTRLGLIEMDERFCAVMERSWDWRRERTRLAREASARHKRDISH